MSWRYSQSTGNLLRPNGTLCGTGYAGTKDGRNNPAKQNVKNIGPIPQGQYNRGVVIQQHASVGQFAIRLEPFPTNVMFGRSAFLMHGDNAKHDASEGCIIMARPIREEFARSSDIVLEVTA